MANVGALGLYYKTAYAAVRAACPECFVAISPLLWQQDGGAWQGFMAAAPYTRVLQDLHRCNAYCCRLLVCLRPRP